MQIFKNSVGLYIGPRTVQIAHLNLIAGKIHLINFVHIDIFEEEQKAAAGTEQENLLVNSLRKAVLKSKIDLKKINTVLLPGMVLLRYFQMPRISAEEMEEAVKFEAKKYIPFKLEEAVTGFYIIRDDKEMKKMGILSLVTKEEALKNHLSLLKKAEISPLSIETASFAIIRLLEYAGDLDKQNSNAVLYVYGQRMNIVILKSGIPYFVRDISLAKKEEWIDDETAELLMAKGINITDSRVIILENMLSELKISFEYYKKELGKEDITKVIVCGEIDIFEDLEIQTEAGKPETKKTCNFPEFLQFKLGIPIHIINPLKNIQTPLKAKPLPYTYPMLAVTMGAALKNLYKTTVEIDLFKARKAPSIKKRLFVNRMLMIEMLILLGCYLFLFLTGTIFLSHEKSLLEKERRSSPKFIDLTPFDITQLDKGEKEIDARTGAYNKRVKHRLYLTSKLNGLTKDVPEGIWLQDLLYSNVLFKKDAELKIDISGNAFSTVKGQEVELINEFSEKLKKDEGFFNGFKIIKTGSVNRLMIEHYAEGMSFHLECSSSTKESQ